MRRVLMAAGLAGTLAFSPACLALDLLQSYDLALANDASYLAARAAADAGREALPKALAQLLPNVSASGFQARNQLDQTTPNLLGQPVTAAKAYTSSNYALTLRQPVYRKQLFEQYGQAQAQVEGVEAALEREGQDVAVRVATAYFEALFAQDQRALVAAQKLAYAGQLRAAARAFETGTGTRTEVDEAQARYDMTLAQELETAQRVDFTRRQLEVYVNQPVGALARLDEQRLQPVSPEPARLEDWVARGEAASPELKSLAAQREAARREVEKARAGHFPSLDLVAQRSRSVSESVTAPESMYYNTQVGVQLAIPLFAGGGVEAGVREAQANLEKVSQQYEAARRNVGLQIRREFQGVVEGVAKVRALEQARRSAEQALHSTKKGVLAGTRTSLDVLNAEQQQVSVLRDLAQARYQYLVARIRLLGLVGGLNREEIARLNAWFGATAGQLAGG